MTHSLTSTRPAAGQLLARAYAHLGALTALDDALSSISVLPAAEDTLAEETQDAARGLRLYATAYTELAATGLTAPAGMLRPPAGRPNAPRRSRTEGWIAWHAAVSPTERHRCAGRWKGAAVTVRPVVPVDGRRIMTGVRFR